MTIKPPRIQTFYFLPLTANALNRCYGDYNLAYYRGNIILPHNSMYPQQSGRRGGKFGQVKDHKNSNKITTSNNFSINCYIILPICCAFLGPCPPFISPSIIQLTDQSSTVSIFNSRFNVIKRMVKCQEAVGNDDVDEYDDDYNSCCKFPV